MIKLPAVAMILFCSLAVCAEEALQDDTEQSATFQLAPIIVTAQKFEQKSQEVPVSLSIISGEQMERSAITSIVGVARQVPSLRVVDWGSRRNAFTYIRGIGSSRQRDSAVGINIDGVPLLNNGTFLLDLNEIERVEVLRGPQGTLYGRNTLAGVINIETKEPTDEPDFSFSSSFGSYELQDYRAAYHGPLFDGGPLIGVSAIKSTRTGYTENDHLGSEVDDRDTFAGRIKLRWPVSDALDILLTIDGEADRDGAFPLTELARVRRRPYHVDHDHKGFENRDIFGVALRVTYRTDNFELTSVSASRKWDEEAGIDQDFSQFDVLTSDWSENQSQFTQELRISAIDETSRHWWMMGVSYFQDAAEDNRITGYGADAAAFLGQPIPDGYQNRTYSDFDNTGHAIFGQSRHSLTDRLQLTVGLRWDHEDKKMDLRQYDYFELGGGVIPGTEFNLSEKDDFDEIVPKLTLSHSFSEDLVIYSTIAKGYRSGGFNNFYTNPSDATFDSEHSWNYELGLKSECAQGRLRTNMAVFLILWENQQVVQFLPPSGTLIRNAGESQSSGLELEIVSRPFRDLRISAGFSCVNAFFNEYRDPAAGANYDGNKLPMANKYDFNISVEYVRQLKEELSFSAGVELGMYGDFYWDSANSIKEDPYELVNLHLRLESDDWEVGLWGKNIFGEEYAAIAFDIPGFPTIGQAGEPGTFGITAKVKF